MAGWSFRKLARCQSQLALLLHVHYGLTECPGVSWTKPGKLFAVEQTSKLTWKYTFRLILCYGHTNYSNGEELWICQYAYMDNNSFEEMCVPVCVSQSAQIHYEWDSRATGRCRHTKTLCQSSFFKTSHDTTQRVTDTTVISTLFDTHSNGGATWDVTI